MEVPCVFQFNGQVGATESQFSITNFPRQLYLYVPCSISVSCWRDMRDTVVRESALGLLLRP